MNLTLENILEFATQKNACIAQLNKFKQLIEEQNHQSAWQTVLGNIHWLKVKGYPIEVSDVERLTNGLGVTWWDNGEVMSLRPYENGKRHGTYKDFTPHGILNTETPYKEGNIHGVRRLWHGNGQPHMEVHYENNVRHGTYKEWYENGVLSYETNYERSFEVGPRIKWDTQGNLIES